MRAGPKGGSAQVGGGHCRKPPRAHLQTKMSSSYSYPSLCNVKQLWLHFAWYYETPINGEEDMLTYKTEEHNKPCNYKQVLLLQKKKTKKVPLRGRRHRCSETRDDLRPLRLSSLHTGSHNPLPFFKRCCWCHLFIRGDVAYQLKQLLSPYIFSASVRLNVWESDYDLTDFVSAKYACVKDLLNNIYAHGARKENELSRQFNSASKPDPKDYV